MLNEKLKSYHLILASGSPRRQQIFKELGLNFEVRLKPVNEVFPQHLRHSEICDYLAQLKSQPYEGELKDHEILITSDTIVWHNNTAVGKPKDKQDAFNMIRSLSGKTHEVITSICFKTKTSQMIINDITKVTFKDFNDAEIWYYVKNFNPLDKAGAYGIQEWIGHIGVIKIEGSYFNVMGLPVHLVYKTLIEMTNT